MPLFRAVRIGSPFTWLVNLFGPSTPNFFTQSFPVLLARATCKSVARLDETNRLATSERICLVHPIHSLFARPVSLVVPSYEGHPNHWDLRQQALIAHSASQR